MFNNNNNMAASKLIAILFPAVIALYVFISISSWYGHSASSLKTNEFQGTTNCMKIISLFYVLLSTDFSIKNNSPNLTLLVKNAIREVVIKTGLWETSKLSINKSMFQFSKADQQTTLPSISKMYSPVTSNKTISNISVPTFYNRVPKCGSDSLDNILIYLSEVNRFGFYNIIYKSLGKHFDLSLEQQKHFCQSHLTNIPSFNVVQGHFLFLDCSKLLKLKDQQINWINWVRHPVSRFQSSFRYSRDLARASRKHRQRHDFHHAGSYEQWLNKDLNSCILTGDVECSPAQKPSFLHASIWFCGSECFKLTYKQALAKSKSNVEQYYSVVGILENALNSLKVLEAYFPVLFNGMSNMEYPHFNNSTKRGTVSKDAEAILHKKLAPEIEFYNFLRQRLHNQLKDLET